MLGEEELATVAMVTGVHSSIVNFLVLHNEMLQAGIPLVLLMKLKNWGKGMVWRGKIKTIWCPK